MDRVYIVMRPNDTIYRVVTGKDTAIRMSQQIGGYVDTHKVDTHLDSDIFDEDDNIDFCDNTGYVARPGYAIPFEVDDINHCPDCGRLATAADCECTE